MLLAILIAQLAVLVLIAVFTGVALFRKLENPEPPAAPPAPAAVAAIPAGIRRDLAQVLTMRGGEWVHHGWAQEDSDAFESALGQPGYAVKRHGQEIEIGRQS